MLQFQKSHQANCSVIRLWQHQMNRRRDNITKHTKLLSPWHEVPFTSSIRNDGLNLHSVHADGPNTAQLQETPQEISESRTARLKFYFEEILKSELHENSGSTVLTTD